MPDDSYGPEKPLPFAALLELERGVGPTTHTQITQGPSKKGFARPRHRMVVQLAEAGWKNQEIGKVLGYSESRVSLILRSKNPVLLQTRAMFAQEVADKCRDVQTRFGLYANEMLDTLVHHAREKVSRPELSRLAARDILHMAGFSPVKRTISAEVRVPVDELKSIMGKINEANEVVMKAEQTEYKMIKTG